MVTRAHRGFDLFPDNPRNDNAVGDHVAGARRTVHDAQSGPMLTRQNGGMSQNVIALPVAPDRHHDGMEVGYSHVCAPQVPNSSPT
jgi:hypothetical protein